MVRLMQSATCLASKDGVNMEEQPVEQPLHALAIIVN